MLAADRSSKRSPFAKVIPRAERRAGGRTMALRTPLTIRTSGLPIDPDLRERIRLRLGWRLGKFALRIERLTVRFEDVNGPRGGRDVSCKIKVVISGLPSVVVSEVAGDAREAFDRLDDRVERVVRGAIQRARERGLLGRIQIRAKVSGRGSAADDEAPVSPSPRNFTRRPRKATAALEASARSRPSRKSTRGSANRAKHGNKLARRERRQIASPKAKRSRARRKR
jgi:sigma 54 modulation/S30EA-like ribosomal protein